MGAPQLTYDGVSPADLAARIRCPSCLVLRSVSSTLDLVHELAQEGAPAGTAVLAEQQVRGRGREGRRWHSPPGSGILLGYLHRPRSPGLAGVLALRVGLAGVGGLGAVGMAGRLKRPNDGWVRGRKAGGVLVGADLAFWADAARFAGALVARQHYLPGLSTEHGAYRARWSRNARATSPTTPPAATSSW